MALTPLTEKEIKAIAADVNKVLKTGNIDELSKRAYNFLYLCSGFIAHYDINGFKAHYEDVNDLKRNLEANYRANMFTNFREGEENAAYYHSKAEVYKRFNIVSQSRANTMSFF